MESGENEYGQLLSYLVSEKAGSSAGYRNRKQILKEFFFEIPKSCQKSLFSPPWSSAKAFLYVFRVA